MISNRLTWLTCTQARGKTVLNVETVCVIVAVILELMWCISCFKTWGLITTNEFRSVKFRVYYALYISFMIASMKWNLHSKSCYLCIIYDFSCPPVYNIHVKYSPFAGRGTSSYGQRVCIHFLNCPFHSSKICIMHRCKKSKQSIFCRVELSRSTFKGVESENDVPLDKCNWYSPSECLLSHPKANWEQIRVLQIDPLSEYWPCTAIAFQI